MSKKVSVDKFKFTENIDLEHEKPEEWVNKVYKRFDVVFNKLSDIFNRKEEEDLNPQDDSIGFDRILDISGNQLDQNDNTLSF